MSQYPHDEFDDVPPYRSGEAGKHRALTAPPAEQEPGKGGSGLKWIAILAVAALLVGGFMYFVLPTLRDSGPEATDGDNGEVAENDGEVAGDDEGEEDTGDGEQADGEEPAEGEEGGDVPQAADTEALVQVFNYDGPAGLENELQGELEEMGYNVGIVEEWQWSDIETPVIYYPPAYEAHAQDLAQNLGIDNVVEDGGSWSNVAVVVGPEYAD